MTLPSQTMSKKISTNSNMSQRVREFVRQSGVEVQSPNSNSNDEFARELEMEMQRAERARTSFMRTPPRQVRPVPRQVQVPQRLQQNLINNTNYEPLSNEFADVKINANDEKMINNVLREFDEPPDLNNENVRALFAPTNVSLQISKLNPGMFNATVDSGFGQKETLVDLKKILMKTPLGKTPIGEGLYIDTREIKGLYGQFKTGFSHTRESGPKGGLNKDFFSAQFMLTLSNDTESKGATVNFYRNGKIRFSGGFVGTNIENQPELIRRFIVNTYTEKQPFFYNPFTYNNLSGQFRINGNFKDFSTIASRKQRLYASVGVTKLDFEPELSPFMYVNYKGHKYNFAQSGNVQISGAPSPADMLVAYNDAIELIKIMNTNGDVEVTGEFPKQLIKGARTPKKRGPKKKTGPRVAKVAPKKKRNAVFNIQINGIQCMRFSKPELVDFAKKLGVVGITQTTKKEEICKKINGVLNKNTTTFRNTNKNKNVKLSGSNKNFKVGKSKCMNYDKTELLRVAKILKIQLDDKETKATLCKKIEKVRNSMLAPKPKPKTPPAKKVVRQQKAQEKKVVRTEQVMKKRGLDDNSIRKDIVKLYGKRWMDRYKNVMPSLNK